MPKPATFTPAEISALASRLREVWRPGSQITPWLLANAERPTKSNREERFSWAAVASALNEVGIMYHKGNPWTAINLAKAVSEVRLVDVRIRLPSAKPSSRHEKPNTMQERRGLLAWVKGGVTHYFSSLPALISQAFRNIHDRSEMTIKTLRAKMVMCENGFTLLEVLVALVILGLAVAMLTGAISDSLARAQRTQTANYAAALADALLTSLGEDIPIHVGVTQGQTENLVWRMVITPAPGRAQVLQLDEVDLTISNGAGHKIGHWQSLRVAP